jgi:deoxyribodipyrimidine photo-lyase
MNNTDAKFCIVWFKRDLRIADHEPLTKASATGLPILPLYIVEPAYWTLPDVSRRHWHFIHDSLKDLQDAFSLLGAPFVIRVGNVADIFENLRHQFGIFELFSYQETGNGWTYNRDIQVLKWCKSQNISWQEFQSNGVIRRLVKRDNWADLRNAAMRKQVIAPPQKIQALQGIETQEIPTKDSLMFGAEEIGNVQRGGRAQGLTVLESFLKERGSRYMQTISKPGVSARNCSRLSAHIAYGTLSIKEIEQSTQLKIKQLSQFHNDFNASFIRNLDAFLSRLAWRCHFVQKLEQQPSIEFSCMHPTFEGMRENQFNDDYFKAWQEGKTGYPLIDACMRSLHQNGWITFRMRAMLVSFASYHLWLDWRKTAPFMAKLFTDYEPGIHYSQFQMQSGVTGINAVRIYNPIKQSIDQDPDGVFIKRYVTELGDVSKSWIHQPWRLTSQPKNYPKPLVDLEQTSKYARDQISSYQKTEGFREGANIVKGKLASRKSTSLKKASFKRKQAASKTVQLEFKF